MPDQLSDNILKIAETVKNATSSDYFYQSQIDSPYATSIFKMINEAYSDLYNVVPLTDEQVDLRKAVLVVNSTLSILF